MLIIFAGLPGTGETTIARQLARQIRAVHVRVDSIEQAILNSGLTARPINEAGYLAAYAVAEDNLRIGQTVIADSVNSLAVTRDAWRDVANRAGVIAIEVEIECTNQEEHKIRVEKRMADIPGLKLPTWREVVSREYQPWEREHLVIDTSRQSVEQSVAMIRIALKSHLESQPKESKDPPFSKRR